MGELARRRTFFLCIGRDAEGFQRTADAADDISMTYQRFRHTLQNSAADL